MIEGCKRDINMSTQSGNGNMDESTMRLQTGETRIGVITDGLGKEMMAREGAGILGVIVGTDHRSMPDIEALKDIPDLWILLNMIVDSALVLQFRLHGVLVSPNFYFISCVLYSILMKLFVFI